MVRAREKGASLVSKRCSCCASEHDPYEGESSRGTCAEFEVFHADRGAMRMAVCHGCSTAITAAWARVRGKSIAAIEVKACRDCGEPTTAAVCESCDQKERM